MLTKIVGWAYFALIFAGIGALICNSARAVPAFVVYPGAEVSTTGFCGKSEDALKLARAESENLKGGYFEMLNSGNADSCEDVRYHRGRYTGDKSRLRLWATRPLDAILAHDGLHIIEVWEARTALGRKVFFLYRGDTREQVPARSAKKPEVTL